MAVSIDQIKRIREETGAPVVGIKRALEEAGGDEKKAKEILRREGFERAEKKIEREVKAGRVFSYIHHSGTLGSLASIACETDFVARTDEFQDLGKEIVIQVASMKPQGVKDLLKQDYVRDPSKTIGDLVKETIAKTGENIQIKEVKRFEV